MVKITDMEYVSMAFEKQLGSTSALSLASSLALDPTALPLTIVVGGSMVTVAAAVFTYEQYVKYKQNEHQSQIKKIDRLYKKYLEKITVSGVGDIRGFPPIFKMGSDALMVESLHLTDEQVEDIGSTFSGGADIALSMYRESIRSAILKLKDYYFDQEDKNDLTACVISYLLYMLEKKFLYFQGYDYDIAYLGAMINFLDGFASLKKSQATQEFTRLGPVHGYLLSAKQYLEKHKESLSIEETISELKDACAYESDQLLRNFSRLVIEDSDAIFLRTVAMDELRNGVLRKEYTKIDVLGISIRNDSMRELPKSVFSGWVRELADYYLRTLDTDTNVSSKHITSPADRFSISTENLKSIRKIFKLSHNFITTKVDHATKKRGAREFKSIEDEAEMLERSRVLSDFCYLIHQVISLQYLCIHLLKSIKQLGEIYVKNPHHFLKVFVVLDELCQQIKESIEKNKVSITNIQRVNDNVMQLEELEVFPAKFVSQLNSTHSQISKYEDRINDFRRLAAPKNKIEMSPVSVESVKHEMFEVVELLAKIYHIDQISLNNDTAEEAMPSNVLLPVVETPLIHSIQRVPEDESITKLEKLNELMGQIFSSMLWIQQYEKPAEIAANEMKAFIGEMAVYLQLRQSLLEMKGKAEQLMYEKDQSQERGDKAKQILDLSLTLFGKVNTFMQQDQSGRRKTAGDLSESVHQVVLSKEASFVDRHHGAFEKFMYRLFGIYLWKTDTRKKLSKVSEACNKIGFFHRTFARP